MIEPIIFKNQDGEYRQWIKDHPDGLIVNIPNLMLHRPDCEHLSDQMTKAPKACLDGSAAAAGLRNWAFRRGKGCLLLCEACEA